MRFPILAFVPAAVFLCAGLRRGSKVPRPVLWAGVAWLAYAAWETAIYFWARSQVAQGDPVLRVDLVLLVPVLYGSTLLAVVLWIRSALR